MKTEIIERLGQGDILVPAMIAEGLSANERVKARLSVLQGVGRHARNPQAAPFNLGVECRAAGLDSAAMEILVSQATTVQGECVEAPGLASLGDGIWADVETMGRCVKAGDAAEGDAGLARLAALKAALPLGSADTVGFAVISQLTSLSEHGGDSLHRLVMDLHKALNRLSAQHAEEIVAGAHAFGLLPDDRPAVGAFMRGLESTRRLKFDHPGLATTVARSGARLTIQNDIGETDAHVVVISVEGDAVTVTYTDVHLARAKFFTGLLRDFPAQWSGLERKSGEALGDDGVFYLVTGRCPFTDPAGRDAFLEGVGASLVFLIDWNKARKVLRTWVPKADAVRVLDWAARNKVGQRGFLELGGSELVAAAVQHAAPTRIGFGERLDAALGRDAAVDFLKTVLKVSAEALLNGSSVRLARDQIEADLVRHLQRVEATLLAIVVRQAGLAREIATAIAHMIAEQQARRAVDRDALARGARRIEEKADRIALEARNMIARFEAASAIVRLVNGLEEAIDELEQAAFVASLVPDGLSADLLKPLADLCAAAVAGAGAAASGAAAAAEVPAGQRIDSEDALAAVGRLIEAEHAADSAERAVTALVLTETYDLKTALGVLELARALERATDRLAGFGHVLREHVLADLSK
ncbi:hypothetical protein V5F77_20210 [Xanthobacter sp. DSM 24535]|uniref:hypothetical protein n=1 Tax=Roseixanthobacter psychrophilus TaxID=3119917 RepID=UPI00372804D4